MTEPFRMLTGQARRFFANAALIVFTLAVAFGFGEFAVRLLYKSETALFPRYHTDYQYGRYRLRGVRPNTEFWQTSVDGSWRFVTNSRGFRNTREVDYPKPPNTFRVLSLGDSHTQGFEVRQDFTFSAVLERFLNQNGRRAEVINAGVSGFSTAEELVFLENEGIKYGPDVVVLGYFANDFEDNVKSGLFGLDAQSQLVEEKFEHVPGVGIQNIIYSVPFIRWLSENSYFYSLLFNNVWGYFKARMTESAVQHTANKDASAAAGADAFEHAVPTRTSFTQYQLELTAALIKRMARFCREREVKFIVVDIPVRVERFNSESSLPPVLRELFMAERIEYIASDNLLKRFEGVSEIHVPHGQAHISEFTHTLMGIEIGQRLVASDSRAN